MSGYFITGTDTDVGKSVASAWALLHLRGNYWKPLQSGMSEGKTDTQNIKDYTSLEDERFFPSRHEFKAPLSPDQAAAIEGISIHLTDFELPNSDLPLVVEGAGGVMVPLNRRHMMIDLMLHFRLPVIVVARSGLGTINHTLLTLQALRLAYVPVAGVILNGPLNAGNKLAIERFGDVRVLAELPKFETIDEAALRAVVPLVPTREWSQIDD